MVYMRSDSSPAPPPWPPRWLAPAARPCFFARFRLRGESIQAKASAKALSSGEGCGDGDSEGDGGRGKDPDARGEDAGDGNSGSAGEEDDRAAGQGVTCSRA